MRKIILTLCCLLFVLHVFAQEEEQTPYEIALARIARAYERNSLLVDLADLELDRVPPEIGQLTHITNFQPSQNIFSYYVQPNVQPKLQKS